MKLTIDSITNAMKGNDFWLNPLEENAQIVAEATRRGYLKRLSWTQIQWTEAGLEKARRELGEICGTCGSVKRMSESPCCMPDARKSRKYTIEEVQKVIRETCNDLSRNDLKSLGALIAFRDEILERLSALSNPD